MKQHFKAATAFLLALSFGGLLRLHAQETAAITRHKALDLEKSNQVAESEKAWTELISADPHNAEALAHMGLLEARQNRLESAIDYYRRAGAIDPDLPGLQTNLGLALFKAGQFPDALKSLSLALRKLPGDQRLTILLGMTHYALKDYLVAIPYLQLGVRADPQNTPLRVSLARSCLASKQYSCVIDSWNAMHASSLRSPELDLVAAEALDQAGQADEAIKELNEAAQTNPNPPDLHFALGYLLWTQKKWQNAANEFQFELQNNPQHQRASIYWADCMVRENKVAEALPEIQKLAVSNPAEPLPHLDLAINFSISGRLDDALREAGIAKGLAPEDPEPHRETAKILETMGRGAEARIEAQAAIRLSPPPLEDLIEPQTP